MNEGKTIVVGDIHGCFDELQELVFDACGYNYLEDRLISVGDMVDRGPESGEVVRFIRKNGEAVMGNHEQWHLRRRAGWVWDKEKNMLVREDGTTQGVPHHKENVGQHLMEEDWQWIEELPYYIDLPEYGAAVVHAGCFPNVPLQIQTENHLARIQCIKPPGRFSYSPSEVTDPDHKFWTNFWTGPQRVIFGHTHLTKPLVSEKAVGLDTGCVHGRALTAVILPEWKIVSVPARRVYHDIPRDREEPTRVETYPVMDDVRCY